MRKKLLVAVETVGVGLIVAGIAVFSVPAALIAAGAAVVTAIEVRG